MENRNPKINANLAWNEIDHEVVIIALDHEKWFHELNRTGSEIWKKCDGEHSPQQIAEAVAQSFDIALSQAQEDTREFLNDLESKKLIHWS